MEVQPVRVFLTSLSVLNTPLSTNYYYFTLPDGRRKYLSARFTNEVGAKFILSQENLKIDRMVIIGSNLTVNRDGNESVTLSNRSFRTLPAEEGERAFALPYLVYTVRDYLNNCDLEDRKAAEIEPARQEELRQLTGQIPCLREEADKSRWFDVASTVPDFSSDLARILRQNIEGVYVRVDEYDKFHFDGDVSGLAEVRWLKEEQFEIDEAIKSLEEAKFKQLTLLRREFLVLAGLRKVERRISDLEKKRQALEDQAALISGLWDLSRRLAQELKDIKTSRLARETAFIKEYLFSLLKPEMLFQAEQKNWDTELIFVPSERTIGNTTVENIRGLVEAIRPDAGGAGTEDREEQKREVELYIDMQGGLRTDGYVRSAVLSILNNELEGKLRIRQVFATNYDKKSFVSEIVDETLRYNITDLVAGMNAFIQYGKTDQLQNYFTAQNCKDKHLQALLKAMTEIDDAITICDTSRLEAGIKKLKTAFSQLEETSVGSREVEIFSVLEYGIKKDYGELLTMQKTDYIKLIEWALRKDFIQQALTIVEAKIPVQMVGDKILYYPQPWDTDRLNTMYKKFYYDPPEYKFIKRLVMTKILGWKQISADGTEDRPETKRDKSLRKTLSTEENEKFVSVQFDIPEETIVDLLWTYNELIIMRNRMNHVSAGKREELEEIRAKIYELIRQYHAIVEQFGKSDSTAQTEQGNKGTCETAKQ